MVKRAEKEKAIKLRKRGYSYSQIKKELGISKGTLSVWLRDMPLSKERLDELQRNEAVIEKIRQSKAKTRNRRLLQVYDIVSDDIGRLSKREIFIAGFFLYWAEGGKTTPYSISLSNTGSAMIRFYITWLEVIGVTKERIQIRLHLYSDMNTKEEISYWIKELDIPKRYFLKSYIKRSKLSSLTHSTRGHGTYNVIVNGRDIAEYVHQGLNKIASAY